LARLDLAFEIVKRKQLKILLVAHLRALLEAHGR